MRIFYVVYIKREPLKSYINAIRLLCNPAEKNSAHLTVRGPYKRRYSEVDLKALNDRIKGDYIHVFGSDSFLAPTQNTVFLDCESSRLRDVWHKPDFGYRPHITLYDGASQRVADSLVRMLASRRFDFSFQAEGLSQLIVKPGQRNLILRCDTNPTVIAQAMGRPLDLATLDSLPESERLKLAEMLVEELSRLSEPLQQKRLVAAAM